MGKLTNLFDDPHPGVLFFDNYCLRGDAGIVSAFIRELSFITLEAT